MRLDAWLVAHGHVRSRERAKQTVKAGRVRVNGAVAARPTLIVPDGASVTCEGDPLPYVSRGALKLIHGLDHFGVDADGQVCLDLGASTGGFTQVLLERGAARVYAVDVGTDQLAPELGADPRVVDLSQTHADQVTVDLVPEPVTVLVCDVSFIGLRKALSHPLARCAPGAHAILLVKPQFELGPAAIGRGGLARLPTTGFGTWIEQELCPWFAARGWRADGWTESPITGGDGNLEFLLKVHRYAP